MSTKHRDAIYTALIVAPLILAAGIVAGALLNVPPSKTSTLSDLQSPIPATPIVEATPFSMDLTGKWHSTNDDINMVATIIPSEIRINWSSPTATDLYWLGVFPLQSIDTAGPADIESTGNTKEMDKSILASQDHTKTFTFDNGVLKFQLTFLGTTTTVVLEKD